ncbi:hypothetical protein BKA82DRAFT_368776 [Pisolithus tinctorius]|nr:hypothetical protein BKA82DRAFT_368776 [Pisolithus tinctorius]
MIGLLLAVFRFWFRYRIQRLWWEDAWAFAAFLFAIIYSMGTWLYVHCEKPTSTVGFWISNFSFNPVIWLGIFLLFISFMAGKLWYYCYDLSWMNNTLFFGNPLLPLSTRLAIFELTTDLVTDAILIALPIKLLWSVKLPTRQRRMILLIFASGIMVTLAAIFRATSVDVEVALSSIMCNLLVFVTFLYRYLATPPRTIFDEDDDYTTPDRPRQTTQFLTTVEVHSLGYYSSENVASTWDDGCTSNAPSGMSDTHISSEQGSEKTWS